MKSTVKITETVEYEIEIKADVAPIEVAKLAAKKFLRLSANAQQKYAVGVTERRYELQGPEYGEWDASEVEGQ